MSSYETGKGFSEALEHSHCISRDLAPIDHFWDFRQRGGGLYAPLIGNRGRPEPIGNRVKSRD